MSPDPKERLKVKHLNGFHAVMYMMFVMEAKLNAQTDLLIELLDIVTQKEPGQVKNETYLKILESMKKNRERFVEDDDLLRMIMTMKINT